MPGILGRRTQSLAARLRRGPLKALERIHAGLLDLRLQEGATHGEIGSRLAELGGHLEWAIDDIKQSILSDAPTRIADDRLGSGSDLHARLRNLSAVFEEESGVRCRFSIDPEHLRLNGLVGEILIRVIAELLAHVEIHAGAGKVEILSQVTDEGALLVDICDDGTGLTPLDRSDSEHDHRSFRLWNVDLWLREIGAQLEAGGRREHCVRIVLPGHRFRR